MKRAQFEIMGLAIVVVIVSMGIFFLLSLSLNADRSDPASQFFQEQFAQNTLDAFLKTTHPTPECQEYQLKDYYQFVAIGNGPASCSDTAITGELQTVLTETIANYQGTDFKFEVRRETCPIGQETCDVVQSLSFNVNCQTPTVNNRPGRQTIPNYPQDGSTEIILWLCAAQ